MIRRVELDTMKIIASTGAKGGVGKSTFAILLALKLADKGKHVVLCDCDVECPNDHLILDKGLDKKTSETIYQEYPVLNKEKCIKCGLCSKTCRENAIFWVKGKYPVFIHDLCTGCGACKVVCPQKAIEMKKEKAGESFVNKVNENSWLVTGRSKAGISETGPIVIEVKKRAMKLAEKEKADVLILDTAPGTHCSVIQALLGCDKAYAVTEPTPLGAHDLSLILDLLKKIGVPAEIVLNKSDVGRRDLIEKIGKKFGVDISKEIPYSEDLVKAYCEKNLEKVVGLV
jgi:MinD superfamily P-loop ATPase